MTKGSEKKLASFHSKCLRRLLNVKWNDFITNIEVLERAETEDISLEIKKRDDGDTWDMPYVWNKLESQGRHGNGYHPAEGSKGDQE